MSNSRSWFHSAAARQQAARAQNCSRREFLWSAGGGLGGIALASMLGGEGLLAADAPANGATGALGKPSAGLAGVPHFPPKAKRVVQLFMAGAASHIDLFDFKPELVKHHGEASDFGEPVEAFQNGLGPWMKPVWEFRPYGQCGKPLSEVVAPLGDVVDRDRVRPQHGRQDRRA